MPTRPFTREASRDKGVSVPSEADYARHVYHIYAIRVQERDRVIGALQEQGIGCGIHYPVPIHLQAAYNHLGYRPNAFPVSERSSAEFISLPMYSELSEHQIERVVGAVEKSLDVAAFS